MCAQADFPVAYKCDEPLRLAIKNDHYICARLLLEHGADANAKYFVGPEITQVPPTDINYLQVCAHVRNRVHVQLLLNFGALPDAYSRDGLTPLMRACKKGADGLQAVRLLLKHGADVNCLALPRSDLRTPLHYAILSGHVPLVEYLLEVGRAHVCAARCSCKYDARIRSTGAA
jgi:ankyrin repeat protein